jgi:p-hydroxybenzoate 3-monooxygenase
MLSHLLHLHGIESVTVEVRSRQHCEARIRAGVLEQGTVDLLTQAGVAQRLEREGLVHRGIELGFHHQRHRIPLAELTNGKCVTVYGQHEVVKDLISRRISDGGDLRFECSEVSVHNLYGASPEVHFVHQGRSCVLAAGYLAGCDGFHGICRPAVPEGVLQVSEQVYPFGWLGILVQAPPVSHELVYAQHERGFALFSMRSPAITRLYLQSRPDENLAEWPDDRIWDELFRRFDFADGWRPNRGPVLQKGVTGMRSFVTEPMHYRRLFLAGDAAHIVPPTGAKGMNLALADVAVLAEGLKRHYKEHSSEILERYSEICLRRVWKAQRFSWWMTSLLHQFPGHNAFDRKRQRAELDYVTSSAAAAASLAENYVGLPLEW